MTEYTGRYFILNGELQPVELFSNSLVYEGESIYEVIRVLKGTPMFFREHINRLFASLRHKHRRSLATMDEIRRYIIALSRSERRKEANLKIVMNYGDGTETLLIYFIESIYPSEEQYLNGVKGLLYAGERETPSSKVINHRFRSNISRLLLLEKGYEAFLVNMENLITEGSRSNIFFIKNNYLYTAPDNLVLNGVTRHQILNICQEQNIPVVMRCASVFELESFDAAFMTGTSPMVLPLNMIGDVVYKVDLPLIKQLRELYIRKAEESLTLFRQGITTT